MTKITTHPVAQRLSRWALALLLLVTIAGVATQRAGAQHQPADKVAMSGNTLTTFRSSPVESATPVTLLSALMKTSSPTDLVFEVNLECSLFTDIVNVANDEGVDGSMATARVDVWIEVDGTPVPVAGHGTSSADDGRVTFCDRTYRRSLSNFSDDDDETKDTIRDYLSTKSTHGFNWLQLDLGNAPSPHVIEVKAIITHGTSGNAENFAEAVVGKRTLIVWPAKLPSHTEIPNL